ncbi:MAG: carboxylating nicotinate-nucleotide diphosphorylase [Bacteroidia bacterium]
MITNEILENIIEQAFAEDIGTGDITSLSTIPETAMSKAKCLIKDDGVLAGVEFAQKAFEMLDKNLQVEVLLTDGTRVKKGDIAFFVSGSARSLLMAERLVLNVMQRMSGIATQTAQVVQLLEGTKCKVLDTRKTTPLIRALEKWAVKIGGGTNHRFGLYDMVMIKDNHADYAGGITNAVKSCQKYLNEHQLQVKIEVETRNLAEVQEALAVGGIDVIMLDNMSLDMMREAVAMIGDTCQTEASGGITLATIREVAETGVDFVSMGALTHSVKSLDISLKAVKN